MHARDVDKALPCGYNLLRSARRVPVPRAAGGAWGFCSDGQWVGLSEKDPLPVVRFDSRRPRDDLWPNAPTMIQA